MRYKLIEKVIFFNKLFQSVTNIRMHRIVKLPDIRISGQNVTLDI